MTTVKRKALSLQEKMKILKIFDENSQTKNQTQLAAELQLPTSTLRTILKNREEIIEKYSLGGVGRKKLKAGKFVKLEKVLIEWFHRARASKLPINGRILCDKAREIADNLQITDFNASSGWIDRFKNRHGIVYRQRSGDSETAPELTWMATLPATVDPSYEVDVVLEEAEPVVLESLPIVTNVQALSAVNVLRRYMSALDESEDALDKLYYIESLVIANTAKSICETKTSD
ncbi:unnamed protein product [Arctia plantaginis]|uniref:HTH CENPB-type domain-containing protein n=1 Tax=Arctia plantaginis TaxID=874455 RepID=A0A8S0YYT7_ARCPL|nr:unnamed protein product [Arctia plantaginis]CAB3232955.1 unnamed protein product [Arctia plantaginis]